jgi:hypothetical protein
VPVVPLEAPPLEACELAAELDGVDPPAAPLEPVALVLAQEQTSRQSANASTPVRHAAPSAPARRRRGRRCIPVSLP